MLRLTLTSIFLLSLSLPATIATAQTTPEASEQKTDDSDLFALPKLSLEDEIASASNEAAEVRKRVETAEERVEAAEERVEAAKDAVEILEGLEKPKSNDSDLFALPAEKTPMEIAREKAKRAAAHRMEADERVKDVNKSVKDADEKAKRIDEISRIVDDIGKRH